MFVSNDVFTTTGIAPDVNRLNFRYDKLIYPVKNYFKDAIVLEMGSHNGRWAYVSLVLGASKVIGVEKDINLINDAKSNLLGKGFDPSHYDFINENADNYDFDNKADIVLCMGLLYYLDYPFTLLNKIKNLNPKLVIIDTNLNELNIPDQETLFGFLESLFYTKFLVKYDGDKRVGYHCYPKYKVKFD